MHRFASLVRETPPQILSSTAITDLHLDATFGTEHTGCGFVGILGIIGMFKKLECSTCWESDAQSLALKASSQSIKAMHSAPEFEKRKTLYKVHVCGYLAIHNTEFLFSLR